MARKREGGRATHSTTHIDMSLFRIGESSHLSLRSKVYSFLVAFESLLIPRCVGKFSHFSLRSKVFSFLAGLFGHASFGTLSMHSTSFDKH